jgi:hypothetical protein
MPPPRCSTPPPGDAEPPRALRSVAAPSDATPTGLRRNIAAPIRRSTPSATTSAYGFTRSSSGAAASAAQKNPAFMMATKMLSISVRRAGSQSSSSVLKWLISTPGLTMPNRNAKTRISVRFGTRPIAM